MINIDPETGHACPSQPLSLIKRHREGQPQFGIIHMFLPSLSCPILKFPAGVIAEADSSSFPSAGVTVSVGDLIYPYDVAAVDQRSPAVHRCGTPIFGLRPRYFSVKSLSRDAASLEPGLKLSPDNFFVITALFSLAAVSIIWAKYGK